VLWYQGLLVITSLSTDKPKCKEWRRTWLCSAKLLLFIEQCVQSIPFFVDSCLLPLLCCVAWDHFPAINHIPSFLLV